MNDMKKGMLRSAAFQSPMMLREIVDERNVTGTQFTEEELKYMLTLPVSKRNKAILNAELNQ